MLNNLYATEANDYFDFNLHKVVGGVWEFDAKWTFPFYLWCYGLVSLPKYQDVLSRSLPDRRRRNLDFEI
jgi:hypothetical protein